MHESVALWRSVQNKVANWPVTCENLTGVVRVGARGTNGWQIENEELYVWVGKPGMGMVEATLESVHVQVPGLKSGREKGNEIKKGVWGERTQFEEGFSQKADHRILGDCLVRKRHDDGRQTSDLEDIGHTF